MYTHVREDRGRYLTLGCQREFRLREQPHQYAMPDVPREH